MILKRRSFLKTLAASSAALMTKSSALNLAQEASMKSFHLATNQYPWGTFYQREKKNFFKDMDASLGEVAASGFQGYEPLVESADAIDKLAPLLLKNHLEMRSLYVNSTLHDEQLASKSIESALKIAEIARQKLGAKIIVTNPNPIRWGSQENKTDAQLQFQAKMLDSLGRQLTSTGLMLAYHNHDPELRMAARELHHMMCATDPRHVHFCLDSHWVYRGAGNSNVALMDVVQMYGARVVEWHLRQSRSGVWCEAFGEGDLDYPALAAALKKAGARPHLVMEQAVESGSPNTLNALEAHRQGVEYARRVLAAL
jgi:inosose dehydratase